MQDYNARFSDAQALAAGDSENILHVTQEADSGKSGQLLALEVIVGKGTAPVTAPLQIDLSTGELEDGSDAEINASFFVPAEKVTTGGTVFVSFLMTGLKPYHKLTYAGATGATGATITAGYALHGGQTNMMA